jgi:predicted flavoprotein YhiN
MRDHTTGIEGSLIYALSAPIREAINRTGGHRAYRPARPACGQGRASLGQAARLALDGQAPAQPVGLDGVKAALLRELTPATFTDPALLAQAIKALPMTLVNTRPLDEAISSAGGVRSKRWMSA